MTPAFKPSALQLSWWWSPIIYVQTTVLLLWKVKWVLMAERWAACLKGKEDEGGWEGEEGRCWGKWKSIIYRLPAWLAIHLELQVISSLPRLLLPPPLSTSPVLWAERKKKKKAKSNSLEVYITPDWKKKWHTYTRRDNPNPSPMLDISYYSVSPPAPCKLHPP